MKLFAAWVLFVGVMFVASCEKETLKTNEVYKSKDLSLEFKDYTDSRCPSGATCIWAGEAEVYLEAKSGVSSTNFTLRGLGSDTVLYGHRIELVDLLPYPEDGITIPFKDKKVKLNVTKL